MFSPESDFNNGKDRKNPTDFRPVGQGGQPSRLPRRAAVFAWDLHYKCNYDCEYCFYHVTGWDRLAAKNKYRTPEQWEAVWKGVHERFGRCQLRVTAGEPFTYPKFVSVMSRVSRFHDLQITTNASVGPVVKTFAAEVDPATTELDCTFHPLEAEFEPFLENVLALRKAGFVANVCYLAYPRQMEEMADFKKRFLDAGIWMSLAMFWGGYEGRQYPFSYTPEQKRLMAEVVGSDESPELVNMDPIPIDGKICGAGQRYAVIQADGSVYRCGQLCEPEHRMGDIFDPGFRFDSEARPCVVDFCRCKEYQSAWTPSERDAMEKRGKLQEARTE